MSRFVRLVSIAITLVALLAGCGPAPSPTLEPSSQGELKVEPTPAADFLAAFRRGDEATAEDRASPLYRQEWARRQIPITERQTWLPAAYRAGLAGDEWVTTTYVDGFVDAQGQGHLIYVARATQDPAHSIPTIWRLDTDATGRVTWAELVWMFSGVTTWTSAVSGSASDGKSPLPPAFSRMQPRLVVGVRSTQNWEGYYAVWHRAGDHLALNFFGIDESGDVRPGVWTYQEGRT